MVVLNKENRIRIANNEVFVFCPFEVSRLLKKPTDCMDAKRSLLRAIHKSDYPSVRDST